MTLVASQTRSVVRFVPRPKNMRICASKCKLPTQFRDPYSGQLRAGGSEILDRPPAEARFLPPATECRRNRSIPIGTTKEAAMW